MSDAQNRRLPLTVQTLYAELMDLSADDDMLGYGQGSFKKKTVKGRTYWYFAHYAGDRQVETYLGAESPELLQTIAARKKRLVSRRAELERRHAIVRALSAALEVHVDAMTVRILRGLAEAGAFAAGAVLVGSHAFGLYAAVLGRHFSAAHARTGDLDFAAMSIAVEQPVPFADVVFAVEKNMLLVPARPGARISTSLKMRDSDYRVDLLTPGDHDTGPVVLPNLRFGAQRVAYLDYLIDSPIDALVPADVGIRIKIPLPERYALHKLVVAQSRDRAFAAKRAKDLAQAEELIAVLRQDASYELSEAWKVLASRADDAREKALRSLAAIGLTEKDLGR